MGKVERAVVEAAIQGIASGLPFITESYLETIARSEGGEGNAARYALSRLVRRGILESQWDSTGIRRVGYRPTIKAYEELGMRPPAEKAHEACLAEHKPHSANVAGDFYVEDGCCTMCLVPFSEAPELFGECQDPKGYRHCFVKRQPETPDELKKMLTTIRCAELMCIRYRGTDRRIHLELVRQETGVVCDNLPPDLKKRVDGQEGKLKEFSVGWQAANGKWTSPLSKKPWWKFWG